MDREHPTNIEVQRHDLEHVPRSVRPKVKASNRRLGVDIVAEHGMSDRMPDVAILDPVPPGTGVDTDLAHPIIVLRKCRAKRAIGTAQGNHCGQFVARIKDVGDPLVVAAGHTRTASRRM